MDSITNRLTILKKSLKKCKDANRKKIKRRAMAKEVPVDEEGNVTQEEDMSENSSTSLTSVFRELSASEEDLNEKTDT